MSLRAVSDRWTSVGVVRLQLPRERRRRWLGAMKENLQNLAHPLRAVRVYTRVRKCLSSSPSFSLSFFPTRSESGSPEEERRREVP